MLGCVLPVNHQLQQHNMGVLVEHILPFHKVVLLQQSYHVQMTGQFIGELPGGEADRSGSREDVQGRALKVDEVFSEAFDAVLSAQELTHI